MKRPSFRQGRQSARINRESVPRFRAALFAAALAVVIAQVAGNAAPPPPPPPPISLPYANNFLVTGNYVVASVDLPPSSGGGGTLTGEVHFNDALGNTVPPGAEILGAYLYWETIATDRAQLDGTKFRDMDVDVEKTSEQSLSGGTASCFSSGGGSGATYTMYKRRADVRRLLPQLHDIHENATGIRLVNDLDLPIDPVTGLRQYHRVTVPEAGTGNQVPQSAGASLLIIYRNPSEPLRSIVMYEPPSNLPGQSGNFILVNSDGAILDQTIHGIYKSDTSAANPARLTHIVGSGQPNGTERVLFYNGFGTTQNPTVALLGANSFPGTSSASDRSFGAATFNLAPNPPANTLMPGKVNGTYGETVRTDVDHASRTPYDCLSWNAIVFSTPVADVDHDGLPDGIEDVNAVLKDPADRNLPNLNAMGANSHHRDIFVQMDGMHAAAHTTYGPLTPVDPPTVPPSSVCAGGCIEDPNGHIHLPTPAALKLIGDAYKNAPAAVPPIPGADLETPVYPGIKPHFDVGSLTAYKALTPAGSDDNEKYNSNVADDYLVGGCATCGAASAAHVRPTIEERTCGLGYPDTTDCQFNAFPGTVGWMSGFVGYNSELLHFDVAREGLFHQVFYVHARAKPKSPHPCLDPEVGTNADGSCNVVNPLFHVPSSVSGIAQLPGGKVMISLGLWDTTKFVGSAEMNASTTLHELGHNGELWHGGAKAVWNATSQLLETEPNCKPDHLSVMSYLFQSTSLTCDGTAANSPLCVGKLAGDTVVDYSRQVYGGASGVDETSLTDKSPYLLIPGPALQYRTAWYAPFNSAVGSLLGSVAATRYCSGLKFTSTSGPGAPPVSMVRVDGLSTDAAALDWNRNGADDTLAFTQDINFDGYLNSAHAPEDGSPYVNTPRTGKTLNGFDDWGHLRLDQTGGGRNLGGFSLGDVTNGEGDVTNGEGDVTNGEGDVTNGEGDVTNGEGDVTNGEGIELTADLFAGLGYAPPKSHRASVLKGALVCVPGDQYCHRTQLDWKTPNAGNYTSYHVYRWRDNAITETFTEVSPPALVYLTSTSAVDTTELPDGHTFTYVVKADFTDGGRSNASNQAAIVAVNKAPAADADSYSMLKGGVLTITTRPTGVLNNDPDLDSVALPVVKSGSVVYPTPGNVVHGTLSFNPTNGTFTYTPASSYVGTDTFTYIATNPGIWYEGTPPVATTIPLSPDADQKTVTITITAKPKK